MSRRLLELAQLAEKTIEVDGEPVRLREPNALQMMEFRRRRAGQRGDEKAGLPEIKPDVLGAVAYLIEHCVIDEKGEPIYNAEEARRIAGGRSEVFLPLLFALTAWDSEKKTAVKS